MSMRLIKRLAWLPGLLCAAGLIVGCGDGTETVPPTTTGTGTTTADDVMETDPGAGSVPADTTPEP